MIIPATVIIAGICGFRYFQKHTFILSEDEQIQPVTGKITVSVSEDTDIVFTDIFFTQKKLEVTDFRGLDYLFTDCG